MPILKSLLASDTSEHIRDKAVFALSISSGQPAALETLIAAAKSDPSPHIRGQALFWLSQKAGKKAVTAIADAIENDPDTHVKEHAVFALSQLPKDEGVPKLIEVARSQRNPEVRKKAFFWLGQSGDPRALAFIEQVPRRSQQQADLGLFWTTSPSYRLFALASTFCSQQPNRIESS